MLLALATCCAAAAVVPHRRYACGADARCAPMKRGQPTAEMPGMGLDQCKMVCEGLQLWPWPTGVVDVDTTVEFAAVTTLPTFDYAGVPHAVQALLKAMADDFVEETFSGLAKDNGPHTRAGGASASHSVTFTVASADDTLTLGTDEGYILTVDGAAVAITTGTVYGARHALETLSQLTAYDPAAGEGVAAALPMYMLPSKGTLVDRPVKDYRGVMVDTARSWFSVTLLKEVVRGMAMAKMNALHLHLTDAASFPLLLEKHPEMAADGAASPDEVYTADDLADLTRYAQRHGVMVIPEIDQPAHASAGWSDEGANPLAVCRGGNWQEEATGPPPGQLNPTNPEVLRVLGDIYAELAAAADASLFHLGGDEVHVECWNSTAHAAAITYYLDSRGYDRGQAGTFYDLWRNFTAGSLQQLRDVYARDGRRLQKVMNWAGKDSGWNLLAHLGPDGRAALFPKELVMFQVWDKSADSIAGTLVGEGYDVVLSHSDELYLDCGGANWVKDRPSWCAYNSWRHIYEAVQGDTADHPGVRGAEAAMWSTTTAPGSLIGRVFPRAAALGERLWTSPKNATWYDADPRFQVHNERMRRRGLAADQTQPRWCVQHGGHSCSVNA